MRWLKGDAKTLDIRCLKIAKEYCSIQVVEALASHCVSLRFCPYVFLGRSSENALGSHLHDAGF